MHLVAVGGDHRWRGRPAILDNKERWILRLTHAADEIDDRHDYIRHHGQRIRCISKIRNLSLRRVINSHGPRQDLDDPGRSCEDFVVARQLQRYGRRSNRGDNCKRLRHPAQTPARCGDRALGVLCVGPYGGRKLSVNRGFRIKSACRISAQSTHSILVWYSCTSLPRSSHHHQEQPYKVPLTAVRCPVGWAGAARSRR